MRGSKKKQPRSPQKRLYYVDNPNIKELTMLESKSSSRDSGSSSDGVSEAELAEVQVSGGSIAEVVQEEPISAPILQTEPEPEPIAETQLQKQADNLPETIWFAPEKERFQPVYTDDLSDAAVTGAKIAPRTIDGSKLKFGIIGTPWLQDYAVQSINIADKAVTSSKIAPESIVGEHLAEGSVSGGK
ncbi:MAG TPA: hypothetical protein VGN87_03285, partial [Paenibacillus sp.]